MLDWSEAARGPELLTRLSCRHPRATVLIWAVFLFCFVYFGSWLTIDSATSSFLDRSGADWATYQRSLALHGADEFVVVALETETGWDASLMQTIVELSRSLEEVPGVRRVDSLATVPLIREYDGTLSTDPALGKGLPLTDAESLALIQSILSDRIARNSLMSQDGRSFAINVLLDEDVDRDRRQIVGDIESLLVGVPARITGVPVFRTAVNSRTQVELKIFGPVTILLLIVIVGLMLPSGAAVGSSMAVGIVSAVGCLGFLGAAGVPLSLSTLILPSMLLALGCAYSMHAVTVIRGEEGLMGVAFPVVMSGLTTIIGFLAMATVPIDAISQLATFGAAGVALATVAALSLAPALLTLFPVRRTDGPARRAIRNHLFPVLHDLFESHGSWIRIFWLGAVVVALFGLSRIEVSTDIIVWFPEQSSVRQDYEAVRHKFSGITPVNVLIEPRTESADDVTTPEMVMLIDALARDLGAMPEVGKVLSLADPLRLVKASFSEDGKQHLPSSSAEIEQSLLLLSGVTRLEDVLGSDRRSANILLRVNDNSSDFIVDLRRRIADWWEVNGSPEFDVTTTGIMYEFARSEEAIAKGQIVGLVFAVAAIAALLGLVYRDAWTAGIAAIANVVPIFIGFGAMGYFSIPLDAATVCVGSVALGIAVDDTIHVVSAFRRLRVAGRARNEAAAGALKAVLEPLVVTTAAIGGGFAVLALSDFSLIRNVGAVTAAVVVLCLLADVTLLPSLLAGGRRKY